jgi:hypothetical protein
MEIAMFQADAVHSTTAPGTPAGSAVPPPSKVKSKPKRISPAKQRKLVETAIERLVELLDEIDPDPDLEPDVDAEPQGDEEPIMGWSNPTTGFLPGSDEDWTADRKDPGMDQTVLSVDTRDGEFEPSLGLGGRDESKPASDRLH